MSTTFSRRIHPLPLCASVLLCGAALSIGEAKAQVKLDAVRGAGGVGVGGAEKNLPALVRPSKTLRQEARTREGLLISDAFAPNDERGEFLGQMRRGELTPEAAWDKGLLTAQNVFKIAGLWRDWSKEGKALRVHLVALLSQKAPAVFSPDALPPKAASGLVVQSNQADGDGGGVRAEGLEAWSEWKRMVGEYYRQQKDARAVVWYEAALKDWQKARATKVRMRPVVGKDETGSPAERDKYGNAKNDGDPAWVNGVGGLAFYYAETGEPRKAGQTWERAEIYSKNPAWIADALIEAARVYTQAGDTAKAKATYAQVPQYGQGWYTALSYHDQVQKLIQVGKYTEARTLLNQPVIGTGSRVETMRAALLSISGQLHYLAGEWPEAIKDSRSALQQFQLMPEVQREDLGFSPAFNMTQARLMWSERWLKAPLVTETDQLHVVMRRGQTSAEVVGLNVFVRSPRLVPLEVTTNNEGVKARVDGNGESNEYFCQKKVVLEVQPQSFAKTTEVRLTVSSPEFPGKVLSLPLVIEVKDAIEVSPTSLFFGDIVASKSTSATVELLAPTPFRVLSVTPDNPALKVETDNAEAPTNHSLTSHTLRVKFTLPSSHTSQFYAGTLRVTTDVRGQEVIEVPYAARSQ